MFCANCGTKLDEGSRFCAECGTAVSGAVGNNAPPPVQYQQPQGAYQQAVPATKKNPWQYFTGAFKKYAVFSGRARRAEFWWFYLFWFIFNVVTAFLDNSLGLMITETTGVLSTIWSLAVFLPALALFWRRMHDCDKAGPFCFIPIYGFPVLCCTGGTVGSNRFGADPKQEN